MNTINVHTATAAELLAFYNAHSGRPVVRRFSDRRTAERRCTEVLARMAAPVTVPAALAAALTEDMRAAGVYVPGTCPNCGETADITCGRVVESNGRQHMVNEDEALCHACGHEFVYTTGERIHRRVRRAASDSRAAAIAASWLDASVAARRAARHGVRVTDPKGGRGNYRSVREAFLVLALPLGQHIKFRATLKAAGAAEFRGFQFEILRSGE